MHKARQSALVIGGSGMLSDFCKELAKHYAKVGVVGRTKAKMHSLTHTTNITPVYVDYTDTLVLQHELERFAKNFGTPNLVVAWIHTHASDAVLVAAQYCSGAFYEITGQSGAQPGHVSRHHEASIAKLGIEYHRIILGKIGNRWLTNSEISAGVAKAIRSNDAEYIVGDLI